MLRDFAVVPGSEVEVRLYFAELFNGVTGQGQRVFDVSVEGSVPTIFDDSDQFAIAGNSSGFMLSDTVTVVDGVLNLEFLNDVERPALTGIEIIELSSATISSTTYENCAQVLNSNQADPDSTPGDNSRGDDDDTTAVISPNMEANLAAIAHEFGHILCLDHTKLGEALGAGEAANPQTSSRRC